MITFTAHIIVIVLDLLLVFFLFWFRSNLKNEESRIHDKGSVLFPSIFKFLLYFIPIMVLILALSIINSTLSLVLMLSGT